MFKWHTNLQERQYVTRQSFFVILFISLLPITSFAETAYVTDILRLKLYQNPKSQGEIIKTIISGDTLTILERQPRYAKVRTADNIIGWTKSAYLVYKPPPRLIVTNMEKQLSIARVQTKKSSDQMKIALTDTRKYQQLLIENEEKIGIQASQLEKLKLQNEEFEQSMAGYESSVPVKAYLISIILFFIIGIALGWYIIDYRIRKNHGGFRIY